jgi:long-chain acyl-CoA synthetase
VRMFDRLHEYGANTAVVTDTGERLSYRQLADRADASADFLRSALGGWRDDIARLVAVEGDNSVDSLCAYVGAMRAQVPVVLIDPALAQTARKQLFDLYPVDACWRAREQGWHRPVAVGNAVLPHPDLALLLSTSGSTGSPKLVRLSHRNLVSNAAAIASYLELDEQERPVTTLPMHYSFGMSVVNSHLSVGATLLLTSQTIISRAFWDFFQREQGTSLSGVPTMYEMLLRLGIENMDLPSLATMTQAGGALPADTVRRLARLSRVRGWRFFVMYGQTEASPRMAYLPAELAVDKAGSIGRAVPGGSIRLLAGSGKVVTQPHVEGELVYDGPNVMMGYAHCATHLALGDVNRGTLKTGDLAWFDEDGCLYISGRSQRFLKMQGRRLNLDDVESYAREIGMCWAVTGRDDLLLVAVKKPDGKPAQVAQNICKRFRLHHSSVKVIGVADFPRSSSGKIRYAALWDCIQSQPT